MIALVIYGAVILLAHAIAYINGLWWSTPDRWQWWRTDVRGVAMLRSIPVSLMLPFVLLLAGVLLLVIPKSKINTDINEWRSW